MFYFEMFYSRIYTCYIFRSTHGTAPPATPTVIRRVSTVKGTMIIFALRVTQIFSKNDKKVTLVGVGTSLFLIVMITFDNYDHFFCSGLSLGVVRTGRHKICPVSSPGNPD